MGWQHTHTLSGGSKISIRYLSYLLLPVVIYSGSSKISSCCYRFFCFFSRKTKKIETTKKDEGLTEYTYNSKIFPVTHTPSILLLLILTIQSSSPRKSSPCSQKPGTHRAQRKTKITRNAWCSHVLQKKKKMENNRRLKWPYFFRCESFILCGM